MSIDDLQIQEFQSSEEFRAWWNSSEVVEFCQQNPHKTDQLKEHPYIKPWFGDSSQTMRAGDAPAEATAVHDAQAIPEIFGRYRLERELGKGGMGTVYLAADPVLDRRVALKVMTMEGIEATARFMREVRSSAKLKHPNIVQIYEVGNQGKFHYFTMEFIDGCGLDELIDEKKLSPKRVAEIICDMALALHYAHQQGIIHRDIKPANILIDKQGKSYLTDFGLAKELTAPERSLTMSGTVIGTPDYMSPEQARGDRDKVDVRSDVFSLGTTMYYSLTGASPFKDSDLYQVLNRVINKDPLLPTKAAKNLHRDLETICMKCLEKEPARRYQTAGELADARRLACGSRCKCVRQHRDRRQPTGSGPGRAGAGGRRRRCRGDPHPRGRELQPRPEPRPRRRAAA